MSDDRTVSVEALAYIRDLYFNGNASAMGRLIEPPMSRALMHKIFHGRSPKAAHRLALALVKEGYSEDYLFGGQGEPKIEKGTPSADLAANNVLVRQMQYRGKQMQVVFIVTHIYRDEEGNISRIAGDFQMTPGPTEIRES